MGKLRVPRDVQIGLNLISLLDVNDKEHYFEGNVLVHVFWDAGPLEPNGKPFRPWIQVHNIKSVEEIQNDGMTQWHRGELEDKVANDQKGDINKPVNVMETRNFVGKFVSPLNLRHFPFDYQELRITVMSNTTSDATFTHKVGRDANKVAKPLMVTIDGKKKVVCAIKCNLEGDTLSEWNVQTQGNKALSDHSNGAPTPAVVKYDFMEHDKLYSAEGAVYQRLDFFVYVKRELKNMVVSIIIPSAMLSMSSLCVFALDIVESKGERFGVLFTVLLTIIANQFVTQGRLPYLAYMTWLDYCLLGLQIYVYLVIVETAVVESIAPLIGMEPRDADLIALWVLIGVFMSLFVLGVSTGLYLYHDRNEKLAKHERDAADSFQREERRLARLRGLPEPPDHEGLANGEYISDGHKVGVDIRG